MARRLRSDKPTPGLAARVATRVKDHHTPIYAAAIAFFAFVALVPAAVATVSITSLVADSDSLIEEAESALESAPKETREFLIEQLRSINDSDDAEIGIAAGLSIALALFSASGAIGNLMTALNRAYDRVETRSFVKRRGLAMLFLIGAIVLIAAMATAMAVIPEFVSEWTSNESLRVLINIGRFVGLAILMAFSLTVLYRIGPAPASTTSYELHPGGRRSLVSVGSLMGTALFVLLSWGFGVFVQNFGSYNETYGTLAGIIVMLLWLQLVALAILIGAEIDASRASIRLDRARLEKGLPMVHSGT